jgi:hypothetical protein
MAQTIEVTTKVLPGHRIEVEVPELPEGTLVRVLVTLDGEPKKRSFYENLGDYRGGLFKTAEEVEAYIREERDSWER